MERRGQSTVAVAVLIIVMLVFIIIYVLSLPPDDREDLLGITVDDETGRTVRVTVDVDEFFLDPDEVTVDKGDRVIITFRNVGRKDITCEVPDFNEETDTIEPDDSDRVSFIADKRGTFDFFCTVEGRSGRIRGDLEVD